MLKAKLADDGAPTGAAAAPTVPEREAAPVARRARPQPSSSKAAGSEPSRAKVPLPERVAATLEAQSRRQSAFDVAFVLVLGLWAIAIVVALTAGAQWWLFIFCLVATASALLLGVLDSTAFQEQSREE